MRFSLRLEENEAAQCVEFQIFTVNSNFFEFKAAQSDFTVFE